METQSEHTNKKINNIPVTNLIEDLIGRLHKTRETLMECRNISSNSLNSCDSIVISAGVGSNKEPNVKIRVTSTYFF